MSNEMITQLPTVTNAALTDILYAVQGYTSPSSAGTSVQETVQQLLSLITAGTNVSVNFSGGNLVISATGLAGIGWTHVTTTSETLVADNGYVADNAGLVTLLLPTTAAFGSLIYLQGKGAGGWKVAQNNAQQVFIGSASTTSGVGGYIASTNQYDSVILLCVNANSQWTAIGAPQGILTIV